MDPTADFKEELRRSASRKRSLSIEAAERRREVSEKVRANAPTQELLAGILAALDSIAKLNEEQLREIKTMQRQQEFNETAPVKFVVKNRDGNGKITEFEVRR